MERRERVNSIAPIDNPNPWQDPYQASSPDVFSVGSSSPSDQGPCLYIGPAGQRCSRSAVEGGFCPRHRIGEPSEAPNRPVLKRFIAVIGVLVALWPLIADLVRELIRLFR
jgi:hypothetical protein